MVELAASAGLLLDPWQANDLEVILGERADGKWAAREAGLIVSRQNGKGGELEAIELGGLFLFGEELIIHSAHEFKTSIEAFRRLLALVTNTDDLRRRVKAVHQSHGSEGIELLTGQRIQFFTRTGGGGRGFSGDRIIWDEGYNLSEGAVSATAPTMSARPNPQIVVTSSAPIDGDPKSAFLRRFCRRGRAGAPGLAYIEYCAEIDVDPADLEAFAAALDDPVNICQANPSYPYRITDDAMAVERGLMTPTDYARERFGVWNDDEDEVQQTIPADAWLDGARPRSEIVGKPAFALDVDEDRKWAAFGAAGQSSLRGVHIEVVRYGRGTDWVVDFAAALVAKQGGSIAVVKGSPAASLVSKLRRAKVPVDEKTSEDHARYCGQIYDAAISRQLAHLDDPALNLALRNAVQRDFGDGARVWSRKKSTVSIAPIVAVTVALGVFGEFTPDAAEPFIFTIGGR